MSKILKALAVVGEGYGNAPDQLAVASTDGSQLAVFASAPPAVEALKFKGEVVLPIVIMTEDEHQARGIRYDLLQRRLTVADERVDRLEVGLKWESDRNALLLASLTEAEDMLSITSLEAGQRIKLLEGLLRRAKTYGGLTPAWHDAVEGALKPAECCTVSAEDRALLGAGDYTPEELFGVGGKPSCPKCAP